MAKAPAVEALIGRNDEGFYAAVPSIRSCLADGDTMAELMGNLHEVARGLLECDARYGRGGGLRFDEDYFREHGIVLVGRCMIDPR
ncbi:MAG: type II toxin-antitoxin system HicB family antitoxin [Nitrosopumilus sp.]|nr:type II toxin-antitoxin system HicB family antitoxin [Nitrosopumilus sp.]MDA7997617.1 type II toxin-antitoxin system HicB family antitoxin [Nitrosopumilus sp.]CAI9832444.1 hypothetical protein IBTHAUMO2_780015 [Nitrosopumilaceae archaeon]